jgi:hypothetical protein
MHAGIEKIEGFVTKTDTQIAYPPIWYIGRLMSDSAQLRTFGARKTRSGMP